MSVSGGRFRLSLRSLVLLAAVAVSGTVLVVHAQASRTVTDGVYTDVQAVRGEAVYKAQCASCHGAALGGGQAPPLSGDDFLRLYAGSLDGLANKIQNTMPRNDSQGKLTRQQSTDIVAYILRNAKFPAGKTELAAQEASLKLISLPAPPGPPPSQAAGSATAFPAYGNLAQVMRGILFPASNLIFTVQTIDPGAPTPPVTQSASEKFSIALWGTGIYKGWEIVDYAAIAIAEAAPLMLTPGRRCENGKPVPVNDPRWIKLSKEMAEAGMAAYRAAQTRNQETVSDMTGALSESCSNCHSVYRDRRGGAGPGANGAFRCVAQ
jgi:mono/diheme cytochrome c family protein